MTPLVTDTRRDMYDVSFGGTQLGGLQKVDLSKLLMMLDAVKIGSFGKLKLDDRFVGLEDGAEISVDVVSAARPMLNAVVPTATGSGSDTAVIPLVPPLNTLVSNAYAKALVIHPRSRGADTSEDVELYKAVCTSAPISRDGAKDDVWTLTFRVYPDMTKLAAGSENPYGRWTTTS